MPSTRASTSSARASRTPSPEKRRSTRSNSRPAALDDLEGDAAEQHSARSKKDVGAGNEVVDLSFIDEEEEEPDQVESQEMVEEVEDPPSILTRNSIYGQSRRRRVQSSSEDLNGEQEQTRSPKLDDDALESEGSSSRSSLVRHRKQLKGKQRAQSIVSIADSSPPPRRRRRPVIDIELLPLSIVRRYYHPEPSWPPTERSRRVLLEPATGTGNGKKPQTRRRQVDSSRLYDDLSDEEETQKGSERWEASEDDDADEEESDEEEEDSDDDPIALRRGRRRLHGDGNRGMRTRATRNGQASGNLRQSQLSWSRSAISEGSFYGSKPSRMRPPIRSTRKRPYHDESESATPDSGDLEGEEELVSHDDDEGESDELESEYRGSDEVTSSEDDKRKRKKEKEKEDVLGRHRSFCEKCGRIPASDILVKALAKKKKPGKRRKLKKDEISDEELAIRLEGWVECDTCVISSHWDCLAPNQKKDVLNSLAEQEGPPRPGQHRRRKVSIDEKTDFTCARCTANPTCFVCHREDVSAILPNGHAVMNAEGAGMSGSKSEEKNDSMEIDEKPLGKKSFARDAPYLFRCHRCKQACHYVHLRNPHDGYEEMSLEEKADWYQNKSDGHPVWTCHQCREWIWKVDVICAWRPLPSDTVEPPVDEDNPPTYKSPLPREYLVKWVGRGFRHVTWVPHPWILTLAPQRLRNFLENGPSLDLVTGETLAVKGDEMVRPTLATMSPEDDQIQGGTSKREGHHGAQAKAKWEGYGPEPEPDAESAIPTEWHTVDRVLDVMLLPPKSVKKANNAKRNNRILSASPTSSGSEKKGVNGSNELAGPNKDEIERSIKRDGVEPPEEERMDIDDWEKKAGRVLTEEDVDEVARMVTWCFVKWDDLQYDQCCWDTPPPLNSPLYPAFKRALKRYLGARQVVIPVLSSADRRRRDHKAEMMGAPPEEQPECVVGGKLMPFQLEGFQWLLYKHFKRESCILADDMGLGKTIQIASLLGYLGSSELQIYPCLVVVPNSTITNWVREFEKWVPHMRVVPYYGEASSRKIISKYELYHKGLQGKPSGLKAHVVLTTYDMITGSEFRVFGGIPRWEVLCVDEGQRLKSDSNLIFNRLKSLNSVHRILLTGTPLNNNLRELFNLLNFLDKDTFSELEDLEARFENLNESLVTELHAMIKPFILRRIKADVLKLPPKIEIIVPISLAPVQKHVYKGILERNAELLKVIAEARKKRIAKEDLAQLGKKKADVNGLVGSGSSPIRVDTTTDVEIKEGVEEGQAVADQSTETARHDETLVEDGLGGPIEEAGGAKIVQRITSTTLNSQASA